MPVIAFPPVLVAMAREPSAPQLRLRIERVAPDVVAYTVEEGDTGLARTLQDREAARRMRARLAQDADVGETFRDQPKQFLIQIGLFSLRIEAVENGFSWTLEDAGEVIGEAVQTTAENRRMRQELGLDEPLVLEPAALSRRRALPSDDAVAAALAFAARDTAQG